MIPSRFVTLVKQTAGYIIIWKSKHLKVLSSNPITSALANHATSTVHNLKWDHFDSGRSEPSLDHKSKSFTQDPQSSFNEYISCILCDKLFTCVLFMCVYRWFSGYIIASLEVDENKRFLLSSIV